MINLIEVVLSNQYVNNILTRSKTMRAFFSYLCVTFMLLTPVASYANGLGEAVEDLVETAQDNPGKAAGLAGCAAVVLFPPAAIWCAATLVGGVTYDGDTEKFINSVVK